MTGIDPSQPITIASGASVTVHLEVTSNLNEAGQLSASVGALTSPLSFEFAPQTGRGNYTSAMTISDTTGAKGTFYVTVSVRTQDFVVSQVLEVELT